MTAGLDRYVVWAGEVMRWAGWAAEASFECPKGLGFHNPMGPIMTQWTPLWPHGSQYDPMGPTMTPWGPLWPHGAHYDPVGPSMTPWVPSWPHVPHYGPMGPP